MGLFGNRKLNKLIERADKGDTEALTTLGVMYSTGDGVDEDIEKGFRYYLKAAELGCPWGQLNVSGAYLSGTGTKTNVDLGLEWIRKSAEQDCYMAYHNLGNIYEKGEFGVEMDRDKALECYRKAFDLGWVESAYAIGRMYEDEENYAEAMTWYTIAAENGDPYAQYGVATFYACGIGVEIDEEVAFEWCKKAAEQGLPNAQYNLGMMFLNRDDPKAAKRWLKLSADAGYEMAQEALVNL
ncbi:MAG: sel1 repeat family protein [Holosporales bacterium]|jgi:TPR repeat protein|nr:sel1 repeat family protein [Holosporales bacterium]